VHHSQGVLESCMHCARINKVSPCQLTDSSQALERRLRNDLSLPVIEWDEPVYWTPYLADTVRKPSHHNGSPAAQNYSGFNCERKTSIFRSQKLWLLSAIKWRLSVLRFAWGF